MKSLKVRKLAAIVAGGALLGAAVAPMVSAITSAEAKSVTYNAEMSPNVNIVVGSSAAVSDGVWAGNIARKVVEKAVMEKVYTGGTGNGTAVVTDLAAVLSLGGTVTVTGGKTFNSATLNSVSSAAEYEQEIGNDPLSYLVDETLSYKYNGSNTDITVKEKVGVSLNPKFDTDKDLKDLVVEIDAGDVNYTLDLGSGIPIGDTTAATADFTDGSDDNIRIPFFGKTYLVQKVDIDSSRDVTELRLVEDKAKQTFVAGESFNVTGTGDYTGQTMTVTIVSVVATGPAAQSYQAKFNITDEAGNVVDTQTVAAGNFVEFEDSEGDDVTAGDIYLDAASVNTGTNEGTVDVLVGTASVRLKDGENYPYVEDIDTENLNGPYVVTITNGTDTNKLTKIVIKNRKKSSINGTPDTTAEILVDGWPSSVYDDDNPLISQNGHLNSALDDAPSSMSFLEGTGALGEDFFKVNFVGLQNDEELTYLEIGDGEMTFRDASDSSHTVPFFYGDLEDDTSTYSNGASFEFDSGNKTLYYDINKSSTDFNVADGTMLNGVAVNVTGASGAKQLVTDFGDVPLDATNRVVVINGVTYTMLDGNGSASGTATLRSNGYFHITKAALNSSTAAADYLSGLAGDSAVVTAGNTPTEALTDAFFYSDANANAISTAGIKFPLSGDSYTVAYGYQVFENDSNVTGGATSTSEDGLYFYLLGDSNSNNTDGVGTTVLNPTAASGFEVTIPYGSTLQNSKRLAFIGTDTAEDNQANRPYYYPQDNDVGQDSSSTTIFVAQFAVDENNTSIFPTKIYMDTQTNSVPDMDDDDLSLPTSDVNYGYTGSGFNGQSFTLSNKAVDTALEAAYTDWGSKIMLNSKTVEMWIPQNQPQVDFTVTGSSSSTTVVDGEELTVEEGDTGTFSTGTTITVKDITYTATVSDGSTVVTSGSGFTYTTPAALNGKAQVYTDAQSVAGPKIVVGGPAVNALATEVADLLNASGDKVAGVYGSNIIVAGYTAADTGAAAQELISALDAI